MEFTCPTCGKTISRDIAVVVKHTEKHIVDEIKKKHPDWVKDDGTCEKCYVYYKEQMDPERSPKDKKRSKKGKAKRVRRVRSMRKS